jgi:hypothetical protein
LLEPPRTAEDWQRWGWHHRISHQAIRSGVLTKTGKHLTDYILEPINLGDLATFFQRNGQSHIDEAGVLGTTLFDLQEVDVRNEANFRAFVYLHWQAHTAEEQAAGVHS